MYAYALDAPVWAVARERRDEARRVLHRAPARARLAPRRETGHGCRR